MASDRWSEICDRWGSQGYDSLSRAEKTWLNVRALIDSIENGGAISYFYNSAADTFADCVEDLRILGAEPVRTQIERVAQLFPDGVPAECEARNVVINAWPEGELDSLLEEVDDELLPLMPTLEETLSSFLERNGLAT